MVCLQDVSENSKRTTSHQKLSDILLAQREQTLALRSVLQSVDSSEPINSPARNNQQSTYLSTKSKSALKSVTIALQV